MMSRLFVCCCLVAIASSLSTEVQRSSPSRRIVAGFSASTGQFPFQVSLRSGTKRTHYCGAFIITESWIGTAAHCTAGKTPQSVTAVVGALTRILQGTTYQLSRIVNHPSYNSSNLTNDIAILKTAKQIAFSRTVQPIKLLGAYAAEGTNAIAIGWGHTSNHGQAASILQWVNLETIGIEECRSKMIPKNAAKLSESSMCAVATKSGGACMGDSGGPLVAEHLGVPVLIGIISWGVPCAVGYPDVFTRIESYHLWIDSVIGN